MLTQEQINHFDAFGFIILRSVFTHAEITALNDEFERGLNAAYADTPFDGSERHWDILTGSNTPFFASLPEDPRYYEVAEQLFGDDCFPIASDANRYTGNTGWHPDHFIDVSKDTFGIKIAHYLDPVDTETGALRVVPGSHRDPLYTNLEKRIKAKETEDIRDIPCYICKSEPGDLVAFDLRLWHASYGGSSGRRMCTVCYYVSPKGPEEEKGLRWRADNCVKALAPKPFINPHWAQNVGGNEKRARWLQQLETYGFMADQVISNE